MDRPRRAAHRATLFAAFASTLTSAACSGSCHSEGAHTAISPDAEAAHDASVATGIATPLLEASTVDEVAYKDGMRVGRQRTQEKDYAGAVSAFTTALRAKSNDPFALAERGYAHLLADELARAKDDLLSAKAAIDGRPHGSLEPYTPAYVDGKGIPINPYNPPARTRPDAFASLAGQLEFNLGLVEDAVLRAGGSLAHRGLAKLHFRWSNRLAPTSVADAKARGCAVSWESAGTIDTKLTAPSINRATKLSGEEPYVDELTVDKGDGGIPLIAPSAERGAWTLFVPTGSGGFAQIDPPYPSGQPCPGSRASGFHLTAKREGRAWLVTYAEMTPATHVLPQCVCPPTDAGDGGQFIWQGNAGDAPCANPECGQSFCEPGVPWGLRSLTYVDAASGKGIVRVLLDSDDADQVKVTVDSTTLHVRGAGCAIDQPLATIPERDE